MNVSVVAWHEAAQITLMVMLIETSGSHNAKAFVTNDLKDTITIITLLFNLK